MTFTFKYDILKAWVEPLPKHGQKRRLLTRQTGRSATVARAYEKEDDFMKTKKILAFVLAWILVLTTVVVSLPLTATHVHAEELPEVIVAVTLTATDGTQTTVSDKDVDESTYSWDAETATLTLKGYSGRMIATTGNINLHLIGNNTLTMDATATGTQLHALNLDYADGSAIITADEGGTLNIVGKNLQTHFSVIAGGVSMVSGTINIDVDTNAGSTLYAFERGVDFINSGDVYDNTPYKEAVINLSMERNRVAQDPNESYTMYGFYNGAYIRGRENVTINATLAGNDKDTVIGFSDFLVEQSSPDITMTVSNEKEGLTDLYATKMFQGISLTEGGRVEFNGPIYASGIPYATNLHTVTTTPDDNRYFWLDIDGKAYQSALFALADAEGAISTTTVFEYQETPTALTWAAGDLISIPSSKVDDSVSIDLKAGVRGATRYQADSSYWKFEVVEGQGQLPPGLYVHFSGVISGTLTAPCDAGSVTIKITDKNGTPYDTSDDRSITVPISYGACADKDRFLTVGNDTPVEMKSDGSGEGWSYDAASSTLTLSGYNGGPISTEKVLNLHLVGENTITLTDGSAIGLQASGGVANITLTGEENGVLNIVSDSLTTGFKAISSVLYVKSGSVKIDVSSTFATDTEGYGVYGYLEFVSDFTDAVSFSIKLNNASPAGFAQLYGVDNSSVSIVDRDNVAFTVDLTGNENTALTGLQTLHLTNSASTVIVNLDNHDGSASRVAVTQINSLTLKKGGSVDLKGKILTSSLPSGLSPHTITTTPASNGYFWYDTNPHYYYESFEMRDLLGEPVTHAVFAYSDEPAELKWVGDGLISLPGGMVGDYIGTNLWAGIRGSHNFTQDINYWDIEIIDGDLPKGLAVSLTNGKFGDGVKAPCAAGTVRIRVTDRAGTYSDESDDRSVVFDLDYGAFTTFQVNREA